jgi:hypothetical protein
MTGRAMPLATAGDLPCTSAAFAELSAGILGSGCALRFRARGASMGPLVRDGDVLLVRPLGGKPARAGDVVLCETEPGHAVVHRVVASQAGPQGTCYTVQGDRAARPDGTVSAAQVYGRVVEIERAGAHMGLDQPAMRALGWLAAVRSRWNLAGSRPSLLARRLVRKVPGLARYVT